MYQVSTWSYILGMAVYYGIFFFITALILAKLANYIDDTFIFIIAGLLLFFIAAFRLPGIDKDSLVYITAFESFKNPL